MKALLFTIFFLFFFFSNIISQKQIYYNDIGYFHDDLAPVLLNNKWGFIDTFGEIVIEPKYKAYVDGFGEYPYYQEGLTRFVDEETERIGFLNKKGFVEIQPQFYSARSFSEGFAIVGTQNDHVIIDKSGKIVAEKFVAINGYYSDFKNGRAAVQKEFKYGFIDYTGKFVIEPIYDEVRDFSNGYAAVKKEGKWGFIDVNGKVQVEFQFNNEPKSFTDNRAFVQGSNNKWGIITNDGKLIVEPIYDEAFPYESGFAVVSQLDEKWNRSYFILDLNGKAVKTFAKAKNNNETIIILSGFTEGLAVAMKGSQKGLIDTKGNVVVKFIYRDLHPLTSGMAYFEKFDDKTKKVTKGYITKAGKESFYIEQPKF